ncbi:hypothetical protein B0T22DRAFT_435486 [Podospora appendiculata]|uniref:Uncharacterized protein n=1 Tax=Podospora appendiculata TaxID=314037 RepID=A0AAE0XFL5_9PEZI|nr:hypothetical protein B0T22DRAFT_435486 [Podospora appendiculata]
MQFDEDLEVEEVVKKQTRADIHVDLPTHTLLPRIETYAQENKPFWDLPYQAPPTSTELIKAFMNDFCDDSDPYLYQVVEVEGFCHEADLEILKKENGNDERVMRRVALLDDRNDEGTRDNARGTCRPDKGALSAHQLYCGLRRKRYKIQPGSSRTLGTENVSAEPNEPDADRRLIVSSPLYVWRKSNGPIADRRRRVNGKPLRRSRDLNFLNLDPADGPALSVEDCIYEAQISCMVTGIDERSWVGITCVDTYYKGDDSQECAEYYAEQSMNGAKMDPLACGQFDADKPLWKPREYFLRLLKCRIDQTHDYLLPTDDLYPDHTEKYNKRVQRFSNRTIRFLQQIITLLSKTVDAWDTFKEGDMGYFSGLEPLGSTERSGSSSRLLLTIDKHISEVRDLRKEVEAQRQLLESLEREVTQHLQQDSNKIAALQHQSGEHMKVFAIIALSNADLRAILYKLGHL